MPNNLMRVKQSVEIMVTDSKNPILLELISAINKFDPPGNEGGLDIEVYDDLEKATEDSDILFSFYPRSNVLYRACGKIFVRYYTKYKRWEVPSGLWEIKSETAEGVLFGYLETKIKEQMLTLYSMQEHQYNLDGSKATVKSFFKSMKAFS